MRFSKPILLSRDPADRLLLAVLSPIVATMTGGLGWLFQGDAARPHELVRRIGAYVAAEVCFVFFGLAVLVFIWALLAPPWVERVLTVRAPWVLLTISFLVAGAALGMLYVAI